MDNNSVDDFHFNAVIGRGTYAKVCLVTRKKDEKLFALKILKKKYIIEKNQEQHIMTEKQILAEIEHPFLVKCYSTFQDEKKLYFVLEYCPGGELFTLLASKDKLSEEHARFYAGQIVLALDKLHNSNIVYRDLKPQNIIIDKSGYIKLTDFGLSKILSGENEKANTICGTPEYLAPEIIKKLGHGKEVDWWCLGCLIHEMVTGFPPFQNENRMKLFEEILYAPVQLKKFSPALHDLLKKLLQKETSKRLGHKGAEEVKNHPWFEKFNFGTLIQKKMKAPFVPVVNSEKDTGNFDYQFTSSEIHSYEETPQIANEDKEKFKDFSH